MLWKLSLMEEDELGRKQSKTQLNNFLTPSMPNSGLMSKISPWFGGTLDNSTFPVKCTAQCMCLVLVSEGMNCSHSKLLAGCWHGKIFFVFLCPGQEGSWMFVLGTPIFPLNDIGTAGNLLMDSFTQCSCEMGKCD